MCLAIPSFSIEVVRSSWHQNLNPKWAKNETSYPSFYCLNHRRAISSTLIITKANVFQITIPLSESITPPFGHSFFYATCLSLNQKVSVFVVKSRIHPTPPPSRPAVWCNSIATDVFPKQLRVPCAVVQLGRGTVEVHLSLMGQRKNRAPKDQFPYPAKRPPWKIGSNKW